MAVTFIVSDDGVAAYLLLKIDPQVDLQTKVNAVIATAKRKRLKDLGPVSEKITLLSDSELIPIVAAIDAAILAKGK